MDINENFKKLLEKLDSDDYVGLGNPNSKILFIGKEAGTNIDEEIFHGSAKSWITGNDYSLRYEPTETKIRNLNHTWQRYQKLYNSINTNLGINKTQSSKYEISFIEDVFTTEFSQLPAPKTEIAKQNPKFKSELAKRKDSFFKSDFVQEFQIIIIFASDNNYIETYKGEVSDLFKVSFEGPPISCEGGSKIWVNKGVNLSKKPKIVIHTRQLATRQAASINDLIDKLSNIVSDFITENNINLVDS